MAVPPPPMAERDAIVGLAATSRLRPVPVLSHVSVAPAVFSTPEESSIDLSTPTSAALLAANNTFTMDEPGYTVTAIRLSGHENSTANVRLIVALSDSETSSGLPVTTISIATPNDGGCDVSDGDGGDGDVGSGEGGGGEGSDDGAPCGGVNDRGTRGGGHGRHGGGSGGGGGGRGGVIGGVDGGEGGLGCGYGGVGVKGGDGGCSGGGASGG